MTDEDAMRLALDEARRALQGDDVPIGAVVVRAGEVIGAGANRREVLQDPTAHAEILALREAAARLGTWRLTGTTMYVTLEPCPMCAGALVLGRVDRLVYGAPNLEAGAAYSLYNIVEDPRLNHQVAVATGVLADDCAALLRRFFEGRR